MIFDWTEERIKYLHELLYILNPTPTTAEIGRLMGCSKNAVIGKAGRMRRSGHDFPARPNPVKLSGRDTRQNRRDRRKALPQVKALPPLPSEEVARLVPQLVAPEYTEPTKSIVITPKSKIAPKSRQHAPVFVWRQHECCWPIGEPGTRDFRFCDEVTVNGKVYCDDHMEIAYVRVRDRREDAETGHY